MPRVIASFVKAYPDVELILKEGDPEEICQMVDAGIADLAIGTETSGELFASRQVAVLRDHAQRRRDGQIIRS